jgi:acetoin utilization deacetylase AcuC-like enzyme
LNRVGLLYDDVCLKHDTGSHPENASRVRDTYERLMSAPVFKDVVLARPRRASMQEVLLVHSKQYYEYIRDMPVTRQVLLDPDTIFGPGSLDAALSAAGAVVQAVDDIKDGLYDRAFCLIRPPGHHALPQRAMGFCILNNIAIGTAYATRICGFERAAIIDLDVHHGNGTQEIFYDSGDILYCSIHQWPFYPGSGSPRESGRGPGKGKTVNVPLPGGSGEDEYITAVTDEILPEVRAHKPSIIFISAGFDTHRKDPIGDMNLTADSFRMLTQLVTAVATELCEGRIVSALEGGYNIDALAASIQAHIEALLDQD